MPIARSPFMAALALMVATLAGCAGDDPGPAAPATTEPAEVPEPAPPPRLLPTNLDELEEHCTDHRGYDNAAEYTGDGPHPIVIYDREERGRGSVRGLARDSLPGDWLAERPRDAELVACVRQSPGDTRLGECEYTARIVGAAPDATIPLYSQNYRFLVYHLRIPAPKVADLTVEAVEGGCPDRLDYDRDEPPDRVTPDLTGAELRAALEDLVTSPAG